ncbi:ubiquitin-protein transferase [Aureococcus anophagefferens]|nr:ubiquitin-protein transferase [Aureococcus anophagefferens]
MDWKERQTTKKKDDTVEKARLAREARAQQRQQVKPALALGRAARGFLARRRVARLCGERAAKLEPRESGDRAVDGSVASAVAIAAGARPTPAAAGSSPRLWRRRCSAARGAEGREALATRGTRDALAELATRPPAGGSERSGVDAAAWLLALGARPAPAGRGRLARPFALAVAAALAATDNAAAVLCDEDAVICWKVVNGAKQPVVACARLRWHASRSFEAREGVAAAKKKRSLLADVVGSRWARKLEATAGSVESSFAKAFGLSSSKKSSPPRRDAASRQRRGGGGAPPAYSDDDERDLEAFGRFFCLGLAAACPRLRVAALTALAFHDDGPRRLWGYLQARHARALAPSLERYFGAASAPNPPPRDVVVALACVALLRQRCSSSTTASSGTVAPGAFQLRRVAEALKRGLFAHCWREGGPDRRRDAYGAGARRSPRPARRSCRPARPALWLVAEADEGAAREELRKGATRRSRLLLASMPFALPFRARVRLFQEKVCPDGQSNARAEEIRFFDASSPRPTDKTIVRVRRSHVLDDGLDRIAGLSPAALKGRLSVAFVDDWGRAEAGIDAGGLFKEFWTELSGAAFSMDFGLFKTTAHDGLLFPNPDSAFVHGERDHLRLFHFLGRVLGKALREGITIQPRFTRSFLSFVRGDFNYVTLLEDLKSLDPDLHRNLKFLQLYDGDVADLGLDFSVSFDRFGECVTANLIPNGAGVEVTREPPRSVAKFHMVDRLDAQSRAFVGGLGDVVDLALLRRFSEPELQLLISGAEDAVDVDDLKAHARYEGYLPGDKHVKRRAALRSLRPADRAAAQVRHSGARRRWASPRSRRPSRSARCPSCATRTSSRRRRPASTSEAADRRPRPRALLTSVHSGAGFDLS